MPLDGVWRELPDYPSVPAAVSITALLLFSAQATHDVLALVALVSVQGGLVSERIYMHHLHHGDVASWANRRLLTRRTWHARHPIHSFIAVTMQKAVGCVL
jgi:hypothetical protein